MVVKALIEHPVSEWLFRQVNVQLSGRALVCAVNARNHLVRAQRIADANISNTIAYFCATHATEEAVAAFIAAAKTSGYRKLASKVNIRDHAQKAVVSAYAQLIAGHAHDVGMMIAHDSVTDRIMARFAKAHADSLSPLQLQLFSFNEIGDDPSSEGAFAAFSGLFPTRKAMVDRVHQRASFRDEASYAGDKGGPHLSQEGLDAGLREHSLLTLGLIWAAVDVASHDEPAPFVVQVLGAIADVIDEIRPPKVCKHCGH